MQVLLPLACLLLTTPALALGDPPDATCATVKLQLSQQVVLTRTAFDAKLVVNNGTLSLLENVDVDLEILTLDGQPANDRFGIPTPTLTGIGNVDGLGFVLPGDSATIEWQILAKDEATPDGVPVAYTFGGSITSSLNGVPDAVELFPYELTVYPDASLELDYYLQTEVFSDDPFTPEILEPIEPFSLGLIVRNNGQGAAEDLSISQQQPTFLENPAGLALDVKVVASEVCGEPLSPSLDVTLGDLGPAESKTVRWLLTSNITGTLSNLSITWTHEKGTGEDGLSLIESVELHPTAHLVDAARKNQDPALGDPCPDFLVDDPAIVAPIDLVTGNEAKAFPDTLHASTGQVEPILAIVSPTIVEIPSLTDLSIPIDVAVDTPGWHYLRVEDPGNGNFDLVQIARNGAGTPRESFVVGGPGDVCEAWITSRPTSISGDPTPEFTRHQLHLFDWFELPGTYRYDVLYQPAPLESLISNKDVISVSAGGAQELTLNAGPEFAGDVYIVLGSASGTIPGLPIDSVSLPLNPDEYLLLLLVSEPIQKLWRLQGTLDGQGSMAGPSAPAIVVPAGVLEIVGAFLHHAYLVIDLESQSVVHASNAVPLFLVP